MADLEKIQSDFAAALDGYSLAMEAMTGAIDQLKAAEKKLANILDEFSQYMGEQGPFDIGGRDNGDPFSLFSKFAKNGSGLDTLIGELF